MTLFDVFGRPHAMLFSPDIVKQFYWMLIIWLTWKKHTWLTSISAFIFLYKLTDIVSFKFNSIIQFHTLSIESFDDKQSLLHFQTA